MSQAPDHPTERERAFLAALVNGASWHEAARRSGSTARTPAGLDRYVAGMLGSPALRAALERDAPRLPPDRWRYLVAPFAREALTAALLAGSPAARLAAAREVLSPSPSAAAHGRSGHAARSPDRGQTGGTGYSEAQAQVRARRGRVWGPGPRAKLADPSNSSPPWNGSEEGEEEEQDDGEGLAAVS